MGEDVLCVIPERGEDAVCAKHAAGTVLRLR